VTGTVGADTAYGEGGTTDSVAASCWQSRLNGLTVMVNSQYNGCLLSARQHQCDGSEQPWMSELIRRAIRQFVAPKPL